MDWVPSFQVQRLKFRKFIEFSTEISPAVPKTHERKFKKYRSEREFLKCVDEYISFYSSRPRRNNNNKSPDSTEKLFEKINTFRGFALTVADSNLLSFQRFLSVFQI